MKLIHASWKPILFACSTVLSACGAQARPLNVLFIAVDDLRPEIGAYGIEHIRTPNMDRLAAQGMIFTRAYAQYSSCNASRSSLMTGLRPDSTGVPARQREFRREVPQVITLPQHFKQHGYETLAFGKLFHSAWDTAYVGRRFDDPLSWSRPIWYGTPQYYFTSRGMKIAQELFVRGIDRPGDGAEAIKSRSLERSKLSPEAWTKHFVQALPTEAPDIPDSVPYDGQITERAIEAMRELKERPFFLAIGYLRPHLPFVAPKKYWDLYDRTRIPLPHPATVPRRSPEQEIPGWAALRGPPTGELRAQYLEIPKTGPLSAELSRELIHGYRACVSYVDALIGRVLDELDRLKLREHTIVVLWGDHGFHLGEQFHWGKHSAFEFANRVPLIVSSPGQKARGQRSSALVELVDIYPSLCEMAGLSQPLFVEGTSFLPLLDAPDLPWKKAAFSQVLYGKVEGRSMRTDRYRFTRWHEQGRSESPMAVELYDFAQHTTEIENLAHLPESAGLVREMESMLRAGWKAAKP
jgi:iduronate 2-sulfatase